MFTKLSSKAGWKALAAVMAITVAAAHLFLASGIDPKALVLEPCRVFRDREGRMLRFLPDVRGERHLPVPVEDIPPHVRQAFIAAEDERFYYHPGIDPQAVVRALKDNFRAGKIVSGASTITQQLCRLAYPRERTYYRKLVEALRSLRIEASLSKEEILGLYLNRVPLGNNLLGVETASRVYFEKRCRDLTAAEAALLASLPKAPGRMNPYGPNTGRLKARRNRVLGKMVSLGNLDAREAGEAARQELKLAPRAFPMEAPHLVDFLILSGTANGTRGDIHTTVDLQLQKRVEEILASHRRRLEYHGASQAAAVIMDNDRAEILAMAGSLEYSSRDSGYNNGAHALRSPGSALKPFLYALALDSGYTAATVLEDIEKPYPSPGGEYRPLNFNRKAYGPISIREALGNSLNLSAIYMLNQLGYQSLYDTLNKIELINHPENGPDHYGLGLVVGNPEVSLVQLVSAYSSLARGGLWLPAGYVLEEEKARGRRVFSPQASYIVSRILSDASARSVSFGGSHAMNMTPAVALKTGTSTRYRDCWTVGYTPHYTVGVWVGNFAGTPTWKMSGSTAASPIFADIINELYRLSDPQPFQAPLKVITSRVCSRSGMDPGENCPQVREEIFIAGTAPSEKCSYHSAENGIHELPTRYAGWLHDRYMQSEEGRFRLAGFDHDLASVFEEPKKIADSEDSLPIVTGKVTIDQDASFEENDPGPYPAGSRISITSPLDGDTYVLDVSEEGQPVTVEAACDDPALELEWYIDGREYAVTGPPYKLNCFLTRGRHTILAVGPDSTGDMIALVVE